MALDNHNEWMAVYEMCCFWIIEKKIREQQSLSFFERPLY